MKILTTIIGGLFLITSNAHALEESWITEGGGETTILESEFDTQYLSKEIIFNQIDNFVQTPEGGVDWKTLGATKEVEVDEGEDEDGLIWVSIRPEFTEDVKALDGKEITIQGYMFPLDQSESQSKFLFGPFPVSCPYHYHVRNSLIVEANAADPITFAYEAITLKGTLELIEKDDEFNLFYKLQNVRKIN